MQQNVIECEKKTKCKMKNEMKTKRSKSRGCNNNFFFFLTLLGQDLFEATMLMNSATTNSNGKKHIPGLRPIQQKLAQGFEEKERLARRVVLKGGETPTRKKRKKRKNRSMKFEESPSGEKTRVRWLAGPAIPPTRSRPKATEQSPILIAAKHSCQKVTKTTATESNGAVGNLECS